MDDRHEGDRGQPRPPGDGVRIIGAEEAAAALESGSVAPRLPEDRPRYGDRPASAVAGPGVRHRFPLPEGESEPEPPPARVEMPHWTEPPTGEIPRILADEPPPEHSEDDLEAWSAFTARAPRWRDKQADWEEPDFEDTSVLAAENRMGALDEGRTEHSDIYEFEDAVNRGDEVVEDLEPEFDVPDVPDVPTPRRRPVRPEPIGDPRGRVASERDVATAVVTGVGVAIAALLCFKSGPAATLGLALAVVTLCAVEAFDAFRRAGYQPATLLGLTATISAMLATYSKGETALPLVTALTVVFSMLWYLAGVVKPRTGPLVNIAVTVLGFVWVGALGSFAGLLLKAPDREGIAFLLGAVIATVAFDVGGFFVGRSMGRTPLSASSPNKTWEGVLGGAGIAALACVVFVRMIHPWDLGSAFALALVVSVVAPVGDLCESMIKRDLGLKDMGTILPGHGGMLDRFDALLFVLPATYYLVRLLDLA